MVLFQVFFAQRAPAPNVVVERRTHYHKESEACEVSALNQTFLLYIRASSQHQVQSGIFIYRCSVTHLWRGRWKLCRGPCPLLPCRLQTCCSVCFACSAQWKLFPPSGRWCSVHSASKGAGELKSDPPQCLTVANWCQHRFQKAPPRPRGLSCVFVKNTSSWKWMRRFEPDISSCCEIKTRPDVESSGADS